MVKEGFPMETRISEPSEKDGKTRFATTGHIIFCTGCGVELDKELLVNSLLQIDDHHPWKSYYAGGGKQLAPSMYSRHLEVQMTEDEYNGRRYQIDFRPQYWLTFGQLLAYKNYVSNLALELCRMRLPDVRSVVGGVTFKGYDYYYPGLFGV